jgi:hypothetical protein
VVLANEGVGQRKKLGGPFAILPIIPTAKLANI